MTNNILKSIARLVQEHRFDDAEKACRVALAQTPNAAALHHLLGRVLMLKNDVTAAITAFEKSIALTPRADWLAELGSAFMADRRPLDAARAFTHAHQLHPTDPRLSRSVALALRDAERHEESLAWLQKAVALSPDYLEACVSLGSAFRRAGRFDEALENFDHALKLKPDQTEALAGKSFILFARQKPTEAQDLIKPHLKGDQTDIHIALAFGRLAPSINQRSEAANLLSAQTKNQNLAASQRAAALFLAAELFDAVGDFELAWQHVERANRLKGRTFHRASQLALFKNTREAFTREFFDALPTASNRSTRPIFIVGMPRSGTSLLEQILASHPQIHGGGELVFMKQMIHWIRKHLPEDKHEYPASLRFMSLDLADRLAAGYFKRLDLCTPKNPALNHVTDKLPHNFLHLGLIAKLFPRARILHCVRDPRDTCVSIYFQNFSAAHPYAYDLANLGWYYRQYEQLMKNWHAVMPGRILDVRYEDVVSDPERKIRELLGHLDLPWDERCMRFYETERDVATASYDQVVKPIYHTSVGRWRNYDGKLGPLMQALDIKFE